MSDKFCKWLHLVMFIASISFLYALDLRDNIGIEFGLYISVLFNFIMWLTYIATHPTTAADDKV